MLNHINPVPSSTFHFLNIHFNTIFPSTPSSSNWSLSFRFSHQNPTWTSPASYTFLAHLILIQLPPRKHTSFTNTNHLILLRVIIGVQYLHCRKFGILKQMIYILTTVLRGEALWMNFIIETTYQEMLIRHQRCHRSRLTCSVLLLLRSTFAIVCCLC